MTAEDLAPGRTVVEDVAAVLPGDTPVFDKMVFGLAADPAILGAIERTGRRTCILVGLETDVCVAHSAIGLIERGYRVVVVEDATGSPEHLAGIQRVTFAGALVMPIRTLLYEWLRYVEGAIRLRSELLDIELPPGGVVLYHNAGLYCRTWPAPGRQKG